MDCLSSPTPSVNAVSSLATTTDSLAMALMVGTSDLCDSLFGINFLASVF